METIDQLTENYSRHRVPDNATVSGLRIVQIVIGIAITLPAFLVGAELTNALGLVRGIIAITVGGLILSIIASLSMLAGARSRLSTYKLVQAAFGDTGAKVVNLILSFTFLGWFGVTIQLFGTACVQTLSTISGSDIPMYVVILTGSFFMILTTIFGFRAIDALARFAVPLLSLLLVAGLYRILSDYALPDLFMMEGEENARLASVGMGISTALSGFMLAVTILPDITRFTRHKKDCPKAALFSFGIGYPLILILAGIPVLVTGNKDLVATFIQINLGIPALLVIIFATWTTNISNLYSSSLALAQIFPKIRDWYLTAIAGLLGAALALMGIMDHFIDFLLILGVTIPPVAGIYLSEHFLFGDENSASSSKDSKSNFRPEAFIAWFFGVFIAFLSSYEFMQLSNVPAIDGIVVAALTHIFLCRYFKKTRLSWKKEI